MVQQIGRLKILRCLSLLFVIALGLLTVVTTGCGDGDESSVVSNGSNNGQNGQTPSLEVLINQIDTTECPTIKAYVSVTDQDGIVVEGLTEVEFSVFEDGVRQLPIEVTWPATLDLPISVCLALDYSASMSDGDVTAMEEAAVTFVEQMTDGSDSGEIIKFAGKPGIPLVEVFQAHTKDQQALIDAIYEDWTLERTRTALYDAIYKGIEDTALQEGRRAVVAITDGREVGSNHTLDDVINLAVDNEVPVFTIRLGWAEPEEVADLKQIAELSGGKYFYAPGSSDLEEIYLQISEMVVLKQYIVSYGSALDDGLTHDLEITVEYQGLSGSDSREFTACTTP